MTSASVTRVEKSITVDKANKNKVTRLPISNGQSATERQQSARWDGPKCEGPGVNNGIACCPLFLALFKCPVAPGPGLAKDSLPDTRRQVLLIHQSNCVVSTVNIAGNVI